jgi:hypothetical protein
MKSTMRNFHHIFISDISYSDMHACIKHGIRRSTPELNAGDHRKTHTGTLDTRRFWCCDEAAAFLVYIFLLFNVTAERKEHRTSASLAAAAASIPTTHGARAYPATQDPDARAILGSPRPTPSFTAPHRP